MSSEIDLLLERAREGDSVAKQEVLQYLSVRFRLIALRRVKDKEAVEDIVQESCLAVLEKYQTQTFSVGFEQWAWGVLSNNIKNYFRRVVVESQRFAGQQSPENQPAQSTSEVDTHLEASILSCLEKICGVNRRFARILSLVYQGYKAEEICRIMKISKANCHVMLHRGRAMLKSCLREAGHDL